MKKDYKIAKAMIEGALMRDDIIEGEYTVDEDAKVAYIKAGIILAALKNKGIIEEFFMDPVDVPSEGHSVGVFLPAGNVDQNIDAGIIANLFSCFEEVIVDKSEWIFFTTIYRPKL